VPGLLDHRIDILINRLLIEGIDDGSLGYTIIRADLVGNLVKLLFGTTRQEDPSPSRVKARATAPPIEPPAPYITATLFSNSIDNLLSSPTNTPVSLAFTKQIKAPVIDHHEVSGRILNLTLLDQ